VNKKVKLKRRQESYEVFRAVLSVFGPSTEPEPAGYLADKTVLFCP
jgi:hypothetical protein